MFLDDREQSAGRSEENRRFVIRYFLKSTYLFLHRLIRERMEEKLRKKKKIEGEIKKQ